MSQQIVTQHLENVIKNHAQDMSKKLLVITGTTSGTGMSAPESSQKREPPSFFLIEIVKDPGNLTVSCLNLFQRGNSIPYFVTCRATPV